MQGTTICNNMNAQFLGMIEITHKLVNPKFLAGLHTMFLEPEQQEPVSNIWSYP